MTSDADQYSWPVGTPYSAEYQTAEVSTVARKSAKNTPPATGRNQTGEWWLRTAKTLTTKAP